MKLSSRSALALLLGTALAASLSSCDYHWSPGENTQYQHGFVNPPPAYHNIDVNRDSINYKQKAPAAGGVGSAAAIKNGTVQDQLNSAPAGKSTSSPQAPNGTMASPDKATNGTGNKNDMPQPK
ncbi:hypothetical protein AUC43_11090 [Hymenobacter sedentarius]|uniref:Uncharacterized protein n=1 Tax=Hymenobacter sedentarius TaxID=1411621 RepID=A0A0U3SYG3_9BACT|nr:hypothetical protein [Hymenobacter sedentarius]ALW85587.1 hypothetical protein AUC43_11090 [Hymenobacter sedentarius]